MCSINPSLLFYSLLFGSLWLLLLWIVLQFACTKYGIWTTFLTNCGNLTESCIYLLRTINSISSIWLDFLADPLVFVVCSGVPSLSYPYVLSLSVIWNKIWKVITFLAIMIMKYCKGYPVGVRQGKINMSKAITFFFPVCMWTCTIPLHPCVSARMLVQTHRDHEILIQREAEF